MELIDIRNRVFPSLRGNTNWEWFLNKVIEGTDNSLFKFLYSDEQPRTVKVPIKDFKTRKQIANNGTRQKELKVTTSGSVSINDKELKTGTGATVTYNAVLDEFNVTETKEYFKLRGTNLVIIDSSTEELVYFINVDTFAPAGDNTTEDLIEESCKFVSQTLRQYKNKNVMYALITEGGYSVSEELSKLFGELGVAIESVFRQSTDILVVGNLKTSKGVNAYVLERTRDLVIPLLDQVPVVPLDNMLSDIKVYTVASSGTVPDGPEQSVYPNIASVTELQPNLLVKIGLVFGDVEKKSEGYLKINANSSFNLKYGVVRNYVFLECSTLESASILSTHLGLPFAIEINTLDDVVAPCWIDMSPEDYHVLSGKYNSITLSDGIGGDVIQLDNTIQVHAVYDEVDLVKLDYHPNNFKALYSKLFGMKTLDVHSMQAMAWLLYYCGASVRDVIFDYEEEVENTKKYLTRSIRFISVDEGSATGYLYIDCPVIPYTGNWGDKIQGELSYSYLAKIHDTDKLVVLNASKDVEIDILSYDKGIVTFSYTNPLVGKFISELLTKEVIGEVSATVVRKLGTYMFEKIYSGVHTASPEALDLITRSLPLTRNLDVREWYLSVNTTAIKASKYGLISEFSNLQVSGNDRFKIDLSQLAEWADLEVGNGAIEGNVVTGTAPTQIRFKFTNNNSGQLRSSSIRLLGENTQSIEIGYTQEYQDYLAPWVNNQPYVEGVQYQFVTDNTRNFNCILHIRTILDWEIEYSGDKYMFVGATSGKGDRDVLITVPSISPVSIDSNIGYVSVKFKDGDTVVEYSNLIRVVQDIVVSTRMSMDIRVKPQGQYEIEKPLTIDTNNDVVWMMVGCRGQQRVVFKYLNNKIIYQSSWPYLFLTDRDRGDISVENNTEYPLYQPNLEAVNESTLSVSKKDYGGDITLTTPVRYATIKMEEFPDSASWIISQYLNVIKENQQGTVELQNNTSYIAFYPYNISDPTPEQLIYSQKRITAHDRSDTSDAAFSVATITVLEDGFVYGMIGYYDKVESISNAIYLKKGSTKVSIDTWLYYIDVNNPDKEVGLSPAYKCFGVKNQAVFLEKGDYILYRKGQGLGDIDLFSLQWVSQEDHARDGYLVTGNVPDRVIDPGTKVRANTEVRINQSIAQGFKLKSLDVLTRQEVMEIPEEYANVVRSTASGSVRLVRSANLHIDNNFNVISLDNTNTIPGTLIITTSSEEQVLVRFILKIASLVYVNVSVDGVRDRRILGTGNQVSYSRKLTPGNHTVQIQYGDLSASGGVGENYIKDIALLGNVDSTSYRVVIEDSKFFMPDKDTLVNFIVEGDPAEPREYREFPCFCKFPSEYDRFPWNILSNTNIFGLGETTNILADGLGRINRPMFTDSLVIGRGRVEIGTLLENQYSNTFVQNETVNGLAIYYMEFKLDNSDKRREFDSVWANIKSNTEKYTLVKCDEVSSEEKNLLALLEELFYEDGGSLDDPRIKVIENSVKDPSKYNPESGDVLLGFFNV